MQEIYDVALARIQRALAAIKVCRFWAIFDFSRDRDMAKPSIPLSSTNSSTPGTKVP